LQAGEAREGRFLSACRYRSPMGRTRLPLAESAQVQASREGEPFCKPPSTRRGYLTRNAVPLLELHHIYLADIHRVALAINGNNHRQGDRRLCCSHSDNENSEDLAR